jgi:hypothetical protein
MSKPITSKAITALVSLLVIACIGAFAHWISALLAANGILSAVFLALILLLSLAGASLRRSARRDNQLPERTRKPAGG